MSTPAVMTGLMAACGLCSWGIADALRRQSVRLGFTDPPNWRSSHTVETPRAGGLGFAVMVPIATMLAWRITGTTAPAAATTVLAAAVAVALVGLADDRWRLPASLRFVAQSLGAIAVISAGGVVHDVAVPGGNVLALGPLAIPATFLWIVGVTNIYNFMDGIDGIAAAQGVIAAISLGLLSYAMGRYDVASAMAMLSAGLMGFMPLNWPPARMFMGDVGSTFVGFLFAGLAVLPAPAGKAAMPFAVWLIVLSPFLFDATVTLFRRAILREPLLQAHRTHLYQRLVAGGWTHRQTTMLYASVAAWAGALSVFHYAIDSSRPWLYLLGVLLPLIALIVLAARQASRSVRLP